MLNVPFKFPLASGHCRMQYRVMPRRKKFAPDPEFLKRDAEKCLAKWKNGPDDINVENIVDRWRRQRR